MSTKRDYYEILGVSKSSTDAEVKAAYRKMALEWHPDKNQDKKAEAETKFKEINEAYQVLSNSEKRQTYDQYGHAAFDPSQGGFGGGGPFGAGGPFGGFQQGQYTYSYGTGGQPGQNPFEGMDFNDPFEIFESFFGGGFGRAAKRRPRYSMTIEFLEAVRGVTKEVEIEGKKHTIKVPAGANDGTRLRFDEFDISFNVLTHPRFKRDGYDLFVDQNIPFTMAALGGTVEVEMVDKSLKLKVRPGTQSHSMVRLRGEGVQHVQGKGRGDVYVRLVVQVPEKLTGEQKRALEELREVEG